jgi:hypothetical protein
MPQITVLMLEPSYTTVLTQVSLKYNIQMHTGTKHTKRSLAPSVVLALEEALE